MFSKYWPMMFNPDALRKNEGLYMRAHILARILSQAGLLHGAFSVLIAGKSGGS